MATTTLDLLTKLGACVPARKWAQAHPDPAEAWSACENGEWMEWLCDRLDIDVCPARAAHDTAMSDALAAYDVARRDVREAYARDIRAAWKAYDVATRPALAAYYVARRDVSEVYARDIRALVRIEDVLKAVFS